MDKKQAIIGCLLGTAIADALGLPYEGLSRQKINRQFKEINQHRLFFHKGMISDDTEHLCMVAQSLIVSTGEENTFINALKWRLKWWLLLLPAGIGLATLRSIIKLWLGFSPEQSGVFSAGNGTAMRSSILGVCYGDQPTKLKTLVHLSSKITHSDPKAEYGALAVAVAAHLSAQNQEIFPQDYAQNLKKILPNEAEELVTLINQASVSAEHQETSEEFAQKLGLNQGITGYIYHTVPVVIQVWLRHQNNYQTAIQEIIKLGGDTDTTAAILGGIIGARVGKKGIPQTWLNNLWDYPRHLQWIEKVGIRLAQVCDTEKSLLPVKLAWYLLPIRNFIFLIIILGHGFARLLFLI
jgi:ADP-ribosyl-[dinitrogen reductase] hydrolase